MNKIIIIKNRKKVIYDYNYDYNFNNIYKNFDIIYKINLFFGFEYEIYSI